MKAKLASAFAYRKCPATVTTSPAGSDLRNDACHFHDMVWEDVTVADWIGFSSAFYGFTPEAFVYFLPSLLITSLEAGQSPVIPADSLVMALDTSAEPAIWSDWFCERFRVLTSAELDALRMWSEIYLDGNAQEFARVQDTILMLEIELED